MVADTREEPVLPAELTSGLAVGMSHTLDAASGFSTMAAFFVVLPHQLRGTYVCDAVASHYISVPTRPRSIPEVVMHFSTGPIQEPSESISTWDFSSHHYPHRPDALGRLPPAIFLSSIQATQRMEGHGPHIEDSIGALMSCGRDSGDKVPS